jgi:hypothetical protein
MNSVEKLETEITTRTRQIVNFAALRLSQLSYEKSFFCGGFRHVAFYIEGKEEVKCREQTNELNRETGWVNHSVFGEVYNNIFHDHHHFKDSLSYTTEIDLAANPEIDLQSIVINLGSKLNEVLSRNDYNHYCISISTKGLNHSIADIGNYLVKHGLFETAFFFNDYSGGVLYLYRNHLTPKRIKARDLRKKAKR